jgi:hypothetical protein
MYFFSMNTSRNTRALRRTKKLKRKYTGNRCEMILSAYAPFTQKMNFKILKKLEIFFSSYISIFYILYRR